MPVSSRNRALRNIEPPRQVCLRRRVVGKSFQRVAPLVRSNEYPFPLVERNFLGAAVVELRRACRGMVRHLRRLLERAAVLQVSGDARRPEGVVAARHGSWCEPQNRVSGNSARCSKNF
jgi:hypothetical protein